MENTITKEPPKNNKIIIVLLIISTLNFYNLYGFNELFSIWASESKEIGGLKMSSGKEKINKI